MIDKTYGKFSEFDIDEIIIIEFNEFYPQILGGFPEYLKERDDFMEYLSQDKILE